MTSFVINVVIDPDDSRSGARTVRTELTRTEEAADRLGRTLSRALSFAAIAGGVIQVVRLADEFGQLQNRLRTVTDSQQQLESVTERLFQVAQNTRSEFGSTVELYTRLSRSATQLGRSQEEVIRFTETLNQAVILSGASSQEASAGIIQLSQGLASGALRGDELRSVLEQLPAVADVISARLGVTRGELRQLGAEGKITAEVVLDAFADAREELQERFGQTVPTLAQRFQELGNEAVAFAGELDATIGIITEGGSAVQALSEGLGTLRESFEALRRGVGVTEATETLGEVTAASAAQLEALREDLRITGQQLALTGGQSDFLNQRLLDLGRRYQILTGQIKEQQEATDDLTEANGRQNEGFALISGRLAEQERLARLSSEEADIQRDIARAVAQVAAAKGTVGPVEEAEIERRVRTIAQLQEERAERERLESQAERAAERAARRTTGGILQGPAPAGAQLTAQQELIGPLQAENQIIRDILEGRTALAQRRAIDLELQQLGISATEEEVQALIEARNAQAELNTELEAQGQTISAGFSRVFAQIRSDATDLASVVEGSFGTLRQFGKDALLDLARTGGDNFDQLRERAVNQIQAIIAELLIAQALNIFLPGAGPAAGAAVNVGAGALGAGVVPSGGGGGPQVAAAGVVGFSDAGQQPAGAGGVTIVNESDSSAIRAEVESGALDRVIVNRIASNRQQIRQALA